MPDTEIEGTNGFSVSSESSEAAHSNSNQDRPSRSSIPLRFNHSANAPPTVDHTYMYTVCHLE